MTLRKPLLINFNILVFTTMHLLYWFFVNVLKEGMYILSQ